MGMDEREAKLPRWVRDELARLRSEARQLRGALDAVRENNTRVSVGYEVMRRFGIPEHEPVHFKFGDGGMATTIQVRADFASGELQVMGGDSIAVLPLSGNLVRIRLEPR